MENKRDLQHKIRGFFIPEGTIPQAAVKEVLPFFILVTLAWGWMYVVYVRQIETPVRIISFTLLMLLHLGLYWSVFRFLWNPRWLRWYFILQGVLAFVIVLFAGDFGLAIGLYASLVGHAVGTLDRGRDLLLLIPYYVVMAATAIIVQSGVEVIREWAFVALPSIFLSIFIAYLFKRQLELRAQTQSLLEDLQEAHTQLEAYTEQVEELTLAQERQRIARELHDTLAQELTGMVLQLEAVSTHIKAQNNDRAQEILQQAMSQSRHTLSEARKVIDDLRTEPAHRSSIQAAVHQEAARFEGTSGIPCEAVIRVAAPLEGKTQTELLKIISEALNNVARHAAADQAWLRLVESDHSLTLEIEDNGRGFDPHTETGKKGHYGLVGIEERAEQLGGQAEIDSQPGEGTCLRITLPIKEAA